ncbi:apolipoprotein D-like [Chrysoperla carnea]|uniref:apolipoprotein D-like n=1 Tax=Chrysoperla carnea TaxID=189513 RepID=UPI001D0831F0|nr:apolipoprotein D-like [Chrysoperla carnea]
MRQLIILIVGLTIAANNCHGHTYHLGACPVVEPMQGFDMNKMLGVWYVIQKTSTASNCIIYNFTKTEEPGEYAIEQVSQHFALGLTPLEHEYHYKGLLTIPEPAVPGKMTVRFPLSVAGTATYTILGTDYNTYAGIFTCQKLAFAHRQSATILSREKTLDKNYVDKVRNRLASFNVDPYDLSIITQTNCPKPGQNDSVNINIDDQTFTAHSAAEVVRKAGEKIGDGVEYVSSGVKKIYHKVSDEIQKRQGDSEDQKEQRNNNLNRDPKSEAEWLP